MLFVKKDNFCVFVFILRFLRGFFLFWNLEKGNGEGVLILIIKKGVLCNINKILMYK